MQQLHYAALAEHKADHGRATLGRRLDDWFKVHFRTHAAYVSPHHLPRLFRSRTGLSPHRYAMALKLRLALDRLDRHAGRLDILAAQPGFSDLAHLAHLAHLARLFRQAFGVSAAVFLGRRRARWK